MNADPTLHHLTLRELQPQLHSLHHTHHTHHTHGALTSQLGPEFDPTDPNAFQHFSTHDLGEVPPHHLHASNAFEPDTRSRLQHAPPEVHRHAAQRLDSNPNNFAPHDGSSFSYLPPSTPLQQAGNVGQPSIERLRQDEFLDNGVSAQMPPKVEEHGQLGEMKMIEQPPDLEEWRDKLFRIDEELVLTEDE